MKRTILLIILNFALFIATGNATIHYVAHNGQQPVPPYLTWQTAADTIQNAINVCSPGDTVLVANGVYPENLVVDTILSLIGLSADSTVIDGRSLGNITINITANVTIENFRIYGKGNGIGAAAVFSNLSLLQINNSKITDCALGVGCVDGSFKGEKIYMKDLTGGFSLAGSVSSYSYSIDSCVVILNNENSQGISIGYAPNATATITNNIILFTGTRNPQYGIYLGAPKRVYIYNNLVSKFIDNVRIGDIVDTVFVKNNNLLYSYFSGINTEFSTVAVNNNIVKNSTGIYDLGGSHTKSDYNIYWKNGQNFNSNVTYGDSDMVRNPMFVKDTLPNPNLNFDYHLQAFSPGIDKGDPSIKDVDGTRSDIGMFGGPYGQSYTYQDLAPRPPVNLSAVVDSNGIHLKWNKNSEADTAYYNVYRDTVNNFIIDSTKIIGSPADTFFTDIKPNKAEQLYYKITAVDKHGHQSGPSDEISVTITAIKKYPYIITDYNLYQNYPNPFNPTTKIGYRLKENGYVKLMVYDILGRMVSVLVNKYQAAGYYEVEFRVQKSEAGSQLASGIYIYRIEVIGKGNIPVFMDMKKMVCVK